MKVIKKKINGYNVFIHKTKKYSSIRMRFVFEIPYTREDIFKSDVLDEYMIHSSKKYKTRKELNEKMMELYSVLYSINNFNVGEKMFTNVTFTFRDPKLVKDDYIEEAIKFAKEILFYPNFEDGKLDREELERSKDNLINDVGEKLLDNSHRSFNSFQKIAFPNTYEMIDFIDDKKEYVELLNSFSDKELIELHDKIFNRSLIGVVIMGNVDKSFLNYLEKYFVFKESKDLDNNYKDYIDIDMTTPFYTEEFDKDFKESILRNVYHCPSENRRDEIIYMMITRMLSSSGMILHKVLRDELKLVYRVGCGYDKYHSILSLRAYLDKKNKDLAIEGCDKALESLKDISLIEKLLKKIKEENDLDMYIFDEYDRNIFKELYNHAFNFYLSFEEMNSIAETVTPQEILDYLNKIKKVKIHFYIGGKE